jgi:hypothetical protein
MKPILPLLAFLSLAACATTGPSDSERLALYMAHAGEPVNQIRYITPMGWERIDGEHVALNMRPKETWMLTLSGNCLDWGTGSPFLAVNSQTGWLISKFDSIKLAGSQVNCRIDEIRPVDIQAMRAAEKLKRDQGASGT